MRPADQTDLLLWTAAATPRMIRPMTQPDIIALGEPLIEMIRLPEPKDGKPVYQQGVGGDALNAMVAAARQGGSAGLISAVGDDPFGREILAFCKTEGIDTTGVRVHAQCPTGVCFIDPDPEKRSFSYARRGSAASNYTPDHLPESMIAAAKVLHVTAISQAISPSMRASVERAAQIARANDTLVSYDLNLRLNLWSLEEAKACIEAFLPLADIVLPSEDEAELICGSAETHQIISFFRVNNPKIIALKRGSAGVFLAQGSEMKHIPAPNVIAVDSAGAGDSFAGALITHLLETNDTERAARKACEVAAQTVTGWGATEAIPRRFP